MPLTHLSIANAKAKAKEYKLTDSDALYLAVRPSGAKLWRMNYRHLGRQKTLYFGAWPEVGIAAARAKRDAARMQLASDLDPASEKKRQLPFATAAWLRAPICLAQGWRRPQRSASGS